MNRRKFNARDELLIILGFALGTFFIAGYYDILETIFRFSREHEEYEVDEIISVIMVVVGCLAVFSFRRWRETKQALTLVADRNQALEKALAEIKQLRGIVPICSFCKKIRDDIGYWHQVETYVERHSKAEFSHSICPECMEEHYPEFTADEDDDEASELNSSR